MKTIVTLALGVIIGAGAMWYMQKSSEKTLQVDEVIESYSAPAEQTQMAPAAPTSSHQTQGSSDMTGQTQGSH